MDRIESYELYEAENESTTELKRAEFKLKPLKKSSLKKRTALIREIYDYFKQLGFNPNYFVVKYYVEEKGEKAAEDNFRSIVSAFKDSRSAITNPCALWISQMKKEVIIPINAPPY